MNIKELNGRPLRLLIGGSPCVFWSHAQWKNREVKSEGLGWELFSNFLIAKEKFQPDLFLYENNSSASSFIKSEVSKYLKNPIQNINSSLVSAQKRQRFYVKNWECPLPEDRGLQLKDILEFPKSLVEKEKAYCLCSDHTGTTRDYFKKKQSQIVFEPLTVDKCNGIYVCDCYGSVFVTGSNEELEGKLFDPIPDCLVGLVCDKGKIYRVKDGIISNKFGFYKVAIPDGFYLQRKLTINECCRLQNLPDGYVDSVSKQQGYKAIGNGWTADVIIHQLEYGLKDIQKDYPIEVLSMYDGIATGRYCLDKMGFTNITYKAYEIDSHAMKVATTNYPDIIECGDAFQLRKDDWKY